MTPEQIAAVVEDIRERVRSRRRKTVEALPEFELPSLEPPAQARDAAEGKAASIGTVNPRPHGLLNSAIQSVKRLIARALNWLVRDQIEFNRAVLSYMDRQIAAADQQNQALLTMAGELQDVLRHWNAWRPAWEEKITRSEIEALRAVGDAESAAREREERLRDELLRAQQGLHRDFQAAVNRGLAEAHEKFSRELTNIDRKFSGELATVDEKFWKQLETLQAEQQRLIHTELRVIRRRAAAQAAPAPEGAASETERTAGERAEQAESPPQPTAARTQEAFDYARFEERFRGSEEHVRETQRFYLPHFEGCRRVLDLGCGRGEFLELLRENGISAAGVDLSPDAVAACREKNLDVERQDLFLFLEEQADGSADGILCAHVVEHLEPAAVPRLVDLAARKLAPGGVLAIETPNPGCLAIFAGDFFLDPSHRRPVPWGQLHFLFEEAGFGEVRVEELHPAVDVFPELAALDRVEELRGFRRKFFGGLDYAILGRRLAS